MVGPAREAGYAREGLKIGRVVRIGRGRNSG